MSVYLNTVNTVLNTLTGQVAQPQPAKPKEQPEDIFATKTWEALLEKAKEKSDLTIYDGNDTYLFNNGIFYMNYHQIGGPGPEEIDPQEEMPEEIFDTFQRVFELVACQLIAEEISDINFSLKNPNLNPNERQKLTNALELYENILSAARFPRSADTRAGFRTALFHNLGSRDFTQFSPEFNRQSGRLVRLTLGIRQIPQGSVADMLIAYAGDVIPLTTSDEAIFDLIDNCDAHLGSIYWFSDFHHHKLIDANGHHIGYYKKFMAPPRFFGLDMKLKASVMYCDENRFDVYFDLDRALPERYYVCEEMNQEYTEESYVYTGQSDNPNFIGYYDQDSLTWYNLNDGVAAYVDTSTYVYYDPETGELIEFSEEARDDLDPFETAEVCMHPCEAWRWSDNVQECTEQGIEEPLPYGTGLERPAPEETDYSEEEYGYNDFE